MHYAVFDTATKQVVRTYAIDKAKLARAYAHRRDAEYGACRYAVGLVVATLVSDGERARLAEEQRS